jgi:SAM-dependent methyltransferase
MGEDEVRMRARSFGAVAAAYATHRPGYAPEAVTWAVAPVADLASPALLDLGAGTGKLSEQLVTLPGARVTAVEPDPAMLAELRDRLPAVDARSGSAEAVPMPDRSVDAVLVGQAWHWFDAERARAEITRVLRTGGVLAVLRNGEDGQVGWVAGYLDAVEWGLRAGGAARRTFLPPDEDLVDVTERRFANPHPTDTDSMIARLDTFSWVLTAPPAERAALLEQARAYLASRPETSSGRFTLPLVTTVLRALRR